MKAAQVNKLYKQLTPTELANLTIEAVTKRLPDNELDLIQDSLETGLYRLPVWEYRKHLQGYEQLSFVYGLHYWKAQALATVANEHMNDNDLPEQLSDDLLKAAKVFYGKLKSMELALIEVCTKAKIDIEAVKWLAEMTGSEAFMPIPPNTDTLEIEFYRQLFHMAAMIDPATAR